jgi:hypothetical protein
MTSRQTFRQLERRALAARHLFRIIAVVWIIATLVEMALWVLEDPWWAFAFDELVNSSVLAISWWWSRQANRALVEAARRQLQLTQQRHDALRN